MGIVFEEDDIQHCLDKAAEIRELYEMYILHGGNYPKSVDDLRWICSEYLRKSVIVEYVDLPAEGSSIKASYWAMSDGSYRIGVLMGMTEEELRFVVCKELFHVIFDEEGRRSIALQAHVEEVTSTIVINEGAPNCPAGWETLAEIATIEFLFPYDHRARAIDGESPLDYARVANTYGLPRLYVEIAMGKGNMAYVGRRIRH